MERLKKRVVEAATVLELEAEAEAEAESNEDTGGEEESMGGSGSSVAEWSGAEE